MPWPESSIFTQKQMDDLVNQSYRGSNRDLSDVDEPPSQPKVNKYVLAVLADIAAENDRVRNYLKRPPLNSYHEGYGLLAEEVAELFDEIRQRFPYEQAVYTEAMHVAQVAVRIMSELCPAVLATPDNERAK